MQLGNQVEWALHCVATLAGLPEGARLSAAAMAELYEVPPKYLAKALQSLAAAGLVTTTPGPRGGYQLAKPPTQITLLDIVDAVEGRAAIFQCQEIRRRGPCRGMGAGPFKSVCQVAGAMHEAERAYRSVLGAKTVADIVAEVVRDVPAEVLGKVGAWVGKKLVQATVNGK